MSIAQLDQVAQFINDKKLSELNAATEAFQVSLQDFLVIGLEVTDDIEVSEEKLLSVWSRVRQSFSAVGNSLTALIKNGGRRSEIKYWYESNTKTVKAIEGKTFDGIENLMVDVPTGMITTYSEAMLAISSIYGGIDPLQVLKKANTVTDSILSSISKGSDSHESILASEKKIVESEFVSWNKSIPNLEKIFSPRGKSNQKKALSSVFSSMEDLKNVRLAAMEQEEQIVKLFQIVEEIEKFVASVDLFIDFIERSNSDGFESEYLPSKKFVNQFIEYGQTVLLIQDTFNKTVVQQLALEHNLVLVYTAINRALV